MCGIAGAQAKTDSAELRRWLASMDAAQLHRGPDASGTWVSEQHRIGFAHQRLSIIDLSAAGNQPMATPDGKLVICFNGEIYNYNPLRAELQNLGYAFHSHTDTEVILAGVRHWGLEHTLARCIGMFAFALWDETSRCVHLVRDRMGVKPLYYSQQNGLWAFASELKALRPVGSLDFSISTESLARYMRYGYLPGTDSIFKHVHRVPPGGIVTLTLDGRAPVISRYWDLVAVANAGRNNLTQATPERAMEEVAELLDDSVRLRMVADVPVGAFLSGGIDSTTVVALMRRHSAQKISTFTIGFTEDAFNEASHAAAVARHFDTDHHELYISANDMLARVDGIANLIDEPFADASILPTLIVSELASRHLKVVLSGDGGDELFCGYTHYPRVASAWRIRRRIPSLIGRLLGQPLQSWHGGAGWLPRLGSVVSASGPAGVCQAVVSRWQKPSRIVRGAGDLPELWPPPIPALPGDQIENDMMLRDMRYYLPDDILHKVDRASMANSLEAREPLLDHRLIELAWRLPLEMKVRKSSTKWPLREILRKELPEALYERPKQGFGVPISSWLRNELRPWAHDLLNGSAARDFFDMKVVGKLWNEHLQGRHDRGSYLWDVLIFLKWQESLNPARHANAGH